MNTNHQSNDWATRYRPNTFDEIIGQDSIVKVLKNSLANLPPAMLFHGASGTGKTTTARVLANALNTRPFEIDCGVQNNVKDLREYIIATTRKTTLIPRNHTITILDEAQVGSPQFFNALLKTIEQPPKNTYYIICTAALYKIPLPVQNRCVSFTFKAVDSGTIKSHLQKILELEHATLPNEVIDIITEHARGQVRNAIKLLQTAVQNNFDVKGIQDHIAIPTEKHELIKYYFGKIGKKHGEVRQPIALTRWFYSQLQNRSVTENNREHQHDGENARNMAYLYTCLCNEYQLRATSPQTQIDDYFYMDSKVWGKYQIGGKVKNRLKDLEDMNLIKCRIKTYSQPPYKREHYFINLDRLEEICKQTA